VAATTAQSTCNELGPERVDLGDGSTPITPNCRAHSLNVDGGPVPCPDELIQVNGSLVPFPCATNEAFTLNMGKSRHNCNSTDSIGQLVSSKCESRGWRRLGRGCVVPLLWMVLARAYKTTSTFFLDHLLHIHPLCTTGHTPCTVFCSVPGLVGC